MYLLLSLCSLLSLSVNAADNKQRDPKMNAIKIKIDA